MAGSLLNSVGRKTALVVGLPLLVAMALGIGFSWKQTQEVLGENAAEEAMLLADMVATSFALVAGSPEDAERPQAVHRQVNATIEADYRILETAAQLRVIDRHGIVRWSRHVEEVGSRAPDAARLLNAPPQGLNLPGGEHVRPLGGMSCARCHSEEPFKVGAVQVVVQHPRLSEAVTLQYKGGLVFFAAIFAILVAVLAFSLHYLVTRPLARLTDVMQRAENGDFLVRAGADTDDEIGRLAGAFNSMLSRITELKVAEIEASREMESMQRELALKEELERQHKVIEDANRTLSRRVREVTLLLDVARSLNTTLELEEILKLVTEMVGVTMGVDQFTIMLPDEKGEVLRVAASFGFKSEAVVDFAIPVGQGAAGLAAQNRETVYIADIFNDPRYLHGPSDPDGDGSLLCVPMVCKEEVVGTLNFARHAKAAFSENDMMLLQLVGSQAAMAILNARLFAETKELTLTDALTGVFNRRHLFARLEMELARSHRFDHPMSMVMVDIDHFKQLNDTFGHAAGDETLKQVAGLLHESVRKVDLVARYGGEEFTVLLPQIGRREALEVAEKLRRAMERHEFKHGTGATAGRITLSAGVASYPEDGHDSESLLDAADAALYAAKREGRNRATLFVRGMELHPGRQRGPIAEVRQQLKETPEDPEKAAG